MIAIEGGMWAAPPAAERAPGARRASQATLLFGFCLTNESVKRTSIRRK